MLPSKRTEPLMGIIGRRVEEHGLGLRLRVLAISCAVTVVGAMWAVERAPW